ncbi:hypothetical protein PICMEDRAFT_70606 [Pichia membranifaciens NRRL Y-2026]|uniref:BPL/LPL catalytic domain-containing protein n=1 Tax=Pichia membranifaciens NRRL Y-2026 TaxID=763406 RepID=A0A1E3NSB9_9ASCO|nr:hypothetical protein PICMEDRAFT_70606 [Pichia membranifaciens NRRL Y-2026]ODQ49025.1 hypothetical protein PICMEDRAFT_70606 [Pichia membranifaciens NRRL Y-2026]
MNVLVYSGPGTTKPCVSQCLDTFRLLLSPYYSVSSVNERVLKDQPWESKTAVLVIPGGADLPMCQLFRGTINQKIKDFVRKGGKFIGLCSGAYYSSSRCEFEVGNPEMEVSGPRELKFYPGICRGSAIKGFHYASDAGARVVEVSIDSKAIPEMSGPVHLYVNGGGMFVDAHKFPSVEILATYSDKINVQDDDVRGRNAAAVLCTVGRGKALLFGPHPEFSPALMKEDPDIPSFTQVIKSLKATDKTRVEFLRLSLKKLGLRVNEKEFKRPNLTPLFLSSIDNKTAEDLVLNLESTLHYQIQNIIDVGKDKIAVNRFHEGLHYRNNEDAPEDPELAIKKIYLCSNELPDKILTPDFDMKYFRNHLVEFYKSSNQELLPGSIGYTFMYGEVLTSTSVLMDSNFRWLPLLPDGFVITGTVQVLGKGRSGNHWVNPKGVLPNSLLLKLPIKSAEIAPVVFVQYLSSMAYTHAILEYDIGYDEIPVKIKWPNDIYVKSPQYIGKTIEKNSKEITHVKIGGILVNINIFEGVQHLVVGAGLNVSNKAPTTSLNTVIKAMNKHYELVGSEKRLDLIREEKLLAKYLSNFNAMFEKFKKFGFKPFLSDYYKLWLHSNQIVTLNDEGNVKAEIFGITSDWGMLMAKDIKTGNVFQLQPDGNSFDMFNGLISQKR